MKKTKSGQWSLKEIGLVVICLLLVIILREWIISVLEYVYPLTSSVPNNNLLVQIGFCFVVAIIYVIYWNEFVLSSRQGFSHRTGLLMVAYMIFQFFRGSEKIDFYHCFKWSLSYIGICFILIAILECVIYLIACTSKDAILKVKDDTFPLLFDTPSKTDSLNRTKHATALVNKVAATLSSDSVESSFCILLNEQFGAGKSSFFNIVKDEAKKIGLPVLDFRPWLSSSSSSLLADLILLLEKELRVNNKRLADSLHTYAKIVSEIHISSVEIVFDDSLKMQSITDRRKKLATEMSDNKKPILVLVDDVDRLDYDELFSLFKLIRNTADFPYLCYVLAADKESLTKNLLNNGIVDPDLYMRKFFNLELTFPPEDNELNEILSQCLSDVLRSYGVDDNTISEYTNSILKLESLKDVFSTPRDIYRYINLVSITLDIIKEHGILEEVNKLDVLLISLIQFISPLWYKVLRDRNDKLLSYNNASGRFSIKKKNLSAFYTRSMSELRSVIDKKNTDKQESNKSVSLDDVVEETKMVPLNVMKGIMLDLFGSSNYRSPERICYKNEYFKYFAGHYREYEVTSAEVFSMIESSDELFSNSISALNSLRRTESYVHKVLLYVDEKRHVNRVSILNKTILLAEKLFSFQRQLSAYELYPNSIVERIVELLFMQSNEVEPDQLKELDDERREFEDYLSKNDRIDYLSLILKTITISDDWHFIYGDKQLVGYREKLINRFINERLFNNPFDINNIQFIPYLKRMYPVYWDSSFRIFVKTFSNPMEWLYRFVSVNKNGGISWNKKYANAICDGVSEIDSFALNLNIKIQPAVLRDIIELKSYSSISKTNVEGHPFLRDAVEWHRNHSK